MENSFFPQLLCATAPADAERVRSFSAVPAYLSYQVGDGPRLYRNGPPESIRNGVLMADDSRLRQITSSAFFCQQALRECKARGAIGFCANWSRSPDQQMLSLTAALGKALAGQGLTLWVPEAYGSCCPTSKVLISSALSGGTLRQRLADAIKQFGVQRVTLAVERMSADFPLPAREGKSTPLSQEALRELREQIRPSIHFSPEFCANYFTYSREKQVHLVLFDTGGSIRRKLLLAKELGITSVMLAWGEIQDCAEEVFRSQPNPQKKP